MQFGNKLVQKIQIMLKTTSLKSAGQLSTASLGLSIKYFSVTVIIKNRKQWESRINISSAIQALNL